MRPRKQCSVYVCLSGTSLVVLVAGILLLCLWGSLYDFIVGSSLVLKPNSAAYNIWIKNPLPLTQKWYLFNWTNPKEVYNKNVKLRFHQLGPYTYTQTSEKSNITWNANNTVTFMHVRRWYFDATNSNGSLDDLVTSINPLAVSAAYTARDWHYLAKKPLSALIHSVHLTKPVGEVLFEGYNDPLMKIATALPFLAGSHFPPTAKFGWFYGINGSATFEGTFNMDTGVSGQLGELYQWQYANHTPYYPGTCGAFEKASAGDFFPTNLKKDSIIRFFSSNLCRHVELEFEKEEVVNGIIGYKYSAGDRLLDNGTKIPENRCFCEEDCMPSGVLNVSACRYGAPAFISLPHFFKADPYYLQFLEGLTPDDERHDLFMTFEPKTGIPLKVAARLQFNLRMQPIVDIALFEDVSLVYFPVLWFEQVVVVPDSMALNIKLLVNFEVICWTIGIVSISIGVLIQTCLYYKLCAKNLFETKKSTHVNKEEVPLNRSK